MDSADRVASKDAAYKRLRITGKLKMRRETEFFGDDELELVYMARRLNDALELEAVLNEAGLDYLVETGNYTGGFLMKRELTGAFFYVVPRDADATRTLLERSRRRPYIAD